jgi:hypothetical protein
MIHGQQNVKKVRFSVCCNVCFRIHSRCLRLLDNTIPVSARKVFRSESPVQIHYSASLTGQGP